MTRPYSWGLMTESTEDKLRERRRDGGIPMKS